MEEDYIKNNLQVYEIRIANVNGRNKVSYLIECNHCKELHFKPVCELEKGLGRNKKFFCSQDCFYNSRVTTQQVQCTNCNASFRKHPSAIKSTTGNNFCSKSCAATFNNKNKSFGTRRSKQEIFIEGQIKITFPELEFKSNIKTIVGSELDFYFPTLEVAIQINGIFHFKPIYGQSKLDKIQSLDEEKRIKCQQLNINLYEIDCSTDTYINDKLLNVRWQQFKDILEKHNI